MHNLTQPARTTPRPCAHRNVVALFRRCHGPLPDGVAGAPCYVAAGTCALARRVAASLPAIQKLHRDTRPLPRALLRVSQHPCAVSQGAELRIVVLCRDAKPAPPTTIQRIVSRQTPLARPPARALGCIARTGRCIVAHARPCRGRALAVSWPIPCAPMPVVSRYSLPYRDQASELGSSPSQLLQIYIFF